MSWAEPNLYGPSLSRAEFVMGQVVQLPVSLQFISSLLSSLANKFSFFPSETTVRWSKSDYILKTPWGGEKFVEIVLVTSQTGCQTHIRYMLHLK